MSKYTHAYEATQGRHKVRKHGVRELAHSEYNAILEIEIRNQIFVPIRVFPMPHRLKKPWARRAPGPRGRNIFGEACSNFGDSKMHYYSNVQVLSLFFGSLIFKHVQASPLPAIFFSNVFCGFIY